ncbi:MAG: MFS transporter [Alphaproteobacteria bacterium]|nr:MFS transporter [Alphaproteobacteria bacterium]
MRILQTSGRAAPVLVAPRSQARWLVLGMLFVVTATNFACRAVVSVAGPAIEKTLHLSSIEMGFIFSAFAWSYVIAQIPGGWLLDRFGSKTTYAVALTLWSLFTLLQGGVGFFTGGAAVAAFFVLRLALGAAEAPAFPANGRITAAWFPAQERGFASAVFNAAQYAATAFFAPLIGWTVHDFGWQYAFVALGCVGLFLAFAWNKAVYSPSEHPLINQAELEYIRDGGALIDLDARGTPETKKQFSTAACIRQLLASRMLLGVYIFQYCINVLTYFFLTWFPMYLVIERHMTILKAGFVVSLPAICGFAGGLLGGWISDRLLEAGLSLSAARKIPIVVGMLLAMSMIACNYVTSNTLIVMFMSLSFFGKGVGALGWAVVSDTSPKEAAGLSGALFNTFGNSAGIITPIVIGYILEATGDFSGALLFVGVNAAIAIVAMVFVVGKIQRFELNDLTLRDTVLEER